MKRVTKQRTAILRCLSEIQRPLSVEEILAYTTKEIPSINLSTIYRNLKMLIQENEIALIDLPGGKSCYEIIKKEHHHYFLCDACSKIFSITGCPKGLLDLIPKGFQLLGHSITLNGFCLECQVST